MLDKSRDDKMSVNTFVTLSENLKRAIEQVCVYSDVPVCIYSDVPVCIYCDVPVW